MRSESDRNINIERKSETEINRVILNEQQISEALPSYEHNVAHRETEEARIIRERERERYLQ